MQISRHVIVVSRSWPSDSRSGVSLAAAVHVNILLELGYKVSIIGSHKSVLNEALPVYKRYYVPSFGSGSIYSPIRVDYQMLGSIFLTSKADLIIVEAWQTAITDSSIDLAFKLNIPVAMISHGVSVHSFTTSLASRIRALGWIFYKKILLPRRIKKLSALSSLSTLSKSPRFYDRDLAVGFGLPTSLLINSPVNWCGKFICHKERKPQILLVGYFSYVKNQLAALDLLVNLPENITLRFIGPKYGRYYKQCVLYATKLGLQRRVFFSDDSESNIADEIAMSIAVLSTSITEVLPIVLLEAMASGTPFISSPVGAVDSLQGGMFASDLNTRLICIDSLLSDDGLWNKYSIEGRQHFQSAFTRESVKGGLLHLINSSLPSSQRGM